MDQASAYVSDAKFIISCLVAVTVSLTGGYELLHYHAGVFVQVVFIYVMTL